MKISILKNGFLFTGKNPMRFRNDAVMMIFQILSSLPIVVFARAQGKPGKHHGDRDTRSISPVFQIVDNFVSHGMGDPISTQISPASFFNFRFSCRSSAITSFRSLSRSSSLENLSLPNFLLYFLAKVSTAPSKSSFFHR